ncbi:hypothetical protein C1645_866145 [Glomus cerebriforme]|uniref:F-box domain-containing protein n=1 Tax=Glomus cerebriforme TaxID=658196 RepID=A0A397TL20_9GLOM|nr:hypothetical protein C1645_866145 [Glomus cerebriforme]
MMAHLIEDCLIVIFDELRKDPSSLYSCILVNRFWCRMAMPILWKNPLEFKSIFNKENHKFYNLMISLLPRTSRQLLFDDDIELSLPTISKQPLFNYINFLSIISPKFIDGMIAMLKNERREFNESQLEPEIYKLFINNCKNAKEFYWKTLQPISQYEGASSCFSKLRTLRIEFQIVTSTALFGMAQICQNVEELKIYNCYGDNSGLTNFIDIQKNLKSLCLTFKDSKNQSKQLSEVIERKASTLKKLVIKPFITSLSPKFLPSLINLEYLKLNDESYNANICEWKKYLSIASLPNLQYLKIKMITSWNYFELIEKSLGNILEIKIYRTHNQDPLCTEKLIETIAKNCPKIKKLTIDAELENLNGIKEIFSNCRQLRMINFSTNNDENLNCDKLLEILTNSSSKTLCEFYFIGNWNFTIEGLENFFKSWRNTRKPLLINMYTGEKNYLEDKYRNVVKKYYDEEVIKETNLLEYEGDVKFFVN